jgi:cell division protein FtsB
MTTYKPLGFIAFLLLVIAGIFLLDRQLEMLDQRDALQFRIRQLETRNDELYQQVEKLQDEVDACSHDLQDCFRREEERSHITPR